MPSADPPPSQTTHPDIPPFPNPSTFSLLPDLYLLLTRLQPQAPNTTTTTTPILTFAGPPLLPKDLPNAVYPLKQKISKAKAAISALPDVNRSIEEQEMEIRMLERKIEALKGRMEELGRIAAASKQDPAAMEGVEHAEQMEEQGG